LPKIFNDFYRASNVKKIIPDGSGLGLSAVKKIVERHGGSVSIKSPSCLAKPNQQGSCSVIKLPFDRN
jgi:signal transduction histidine kinase